MNLNEPSSEAVPLVELNCRGATKLILNSKKLSNILENVEDLPLVTINVAGPPSSGKSLLFEYLARALDAVEIGNYDFSNLDIDVSEYRWPNGGRSPDKPGIWIFDRPFIISVGKGKMAVLLLYTQSSNKPYWDADNTDVAALMGLSLLISSRIIFNVFKNLNEQVLSAIGNYVKYAVQYGISPASSPQKGKTPSLPFQDAKFLVRDWNFSSDYPYGEKGGTWFVKSEKLKEKTGHSKTSRQTRHLINNLFQNISGFLMPYNGTNDKAWVDMDIAFKKHLSDLISSLVNVDQLPIKTYAGMNVTGRKFRDILEGYIARVTEIDKSQMNIVSILRRFRVKIGVHPEEQKEYIKIALKVYTEYWKKQEKSKNFFNERELRDIQKKAKNKAVEAFEKEMQQEGDDEEDGDDSTDEDDDDKDSPAIIDRHVKKLLTDKIAERSEEMVKENGTRKKVYLDKCKNELLQQYRESMRAIFPDGERVTSTEYTRRESKDILANLSSEYLVKMGSNGDRESMNDEQEEDMNNFMDMLTDEEKTFMNNLFGNKREVDEVDNDSDDGIEK